MYFPTIWWSPPPRPAKARARDCGICRHRINPFVSSGLLNTLCLLLFPNRKEGLGHLCLGWLCLNQHSLSRCRMDVHVSPSLSLSPWEKHGLVSSQFRDCFRTQNISCVDVGPWWLSLFCSSPELSAWDDVYQDAAVTQCCCYWYQYKICLGCVLGNFRNLQNLIENEIVIVCFSWDYELKLNK